MSEKNFDMMSKIQAGVMSMMLNKVLKQKIDDYIKQNYVMPCIYEEKTISASSETAKNTGLTENEGLDLKNLIEEAGDSFHEKLFQYIESSEMTDVEIYKKAGLNRKLFSKIRSNPMYHPGKNTVLALAIALELNIDETNDLLARAEYAFSPSNKGDLIVKYFIEHKVYDLMAINFTLDEYGQNIVR